MTYFPFISRDLILVKREQDNPVYNCYGELVRNPTPDPNKENNWRDPLTNEERKEQDG